MVLEPWNVTSFPGEFNFHARLITTLQKTFKQETVSITPLRVYESYM